MPWNPFVLVISGNVGEREVIFHSLFENEKERERGSNLRRQGQPDCPGVSRSDHSARFCRRRLDPRSRSFSFSKTHQWQHCFGSLHNRRFRKRWRWPQILQFCRDDRLIRQEPKPNWDMHTPYKSVVPTILQDLRPSPSFTKSSMEKGLLVLFLLFSPTALALGPTIILWGYSCLVLLPGQNNWDSRDSWHRKNTVWCARSQTQGKNRVQWLYVGCFIVRDLARYHTIEQRLIDVMILGRFGQGSRSLNRQTVMCVGVLAWSSFPSAKTAVIDWWDGSPAFFSFFCFMSYLACSQISLALVASLVLAIHLAFFFHCDTHTVE